MFISTKFPSNSLNFLLPGEMVEEGGGRASLSNSEFIAIINVIIFIACVVNIIEKKVRKDRLNARCARVCVDAPRYKAHYTHFLILTYPVLRKNLPR